MKYVPKLFNLEAELKALKNQNFSNNVSPLIMIVMDQKKENSPISILDDYETLIKDKRSIDFFVGIPQNLPLSSKKPKPPISRFFKKLQTKPNEFQSIMNRFSSYDNVIPTLEIDVSKYTPGDLKSLKTSVKSNSGRYAYYVKSSLLSTIQDELIDLITSKDFIIYDVDIKDFGKSTVKKEIAFINSMKQKKNFCTIVIKQIYQELTFFKFPDGKIVEGSEAFDCIDQDFYNDFKSYEFDAFGDCAGIRDTPIFSGGMAYPSYLTIELNTFDHHGFKGLEKDINSFKSVVLPKYLASDHWKVILNETHKSKCNGCEMIINFEKNTLKVNDASKWKTVTISHFLESMDYKIEANII